MAERDVQVFKDIDASADEVWQLLREFSAGWHPLIETMRLEHDDAGPVTRAFTVFGEDTLYRERLTWFSDTERTMKYSHIEGITGAQSYRASICAEASEEKRCRVTMTAKIVADEPRAEEIATGTKEVFEIGLEALAEGEHKPLENVKTGKAARRQIKTKLIDGVPKLAVSYCEGANQRADTICLFLHGIGGKRENWDKQLKAAAQFCTSVSLDLRGYGGSELGVGQTDVDDHCDDVLRVMKGFGAKRLILCGLSFGAWIATSFAMRYGDNLAGLVLAGGCTGMSEAQDAERQAFLAAREAPLSQGQTPADFAPQVLDVIAGPSCSNDARAELLASMRIISPETYRDALRCFTAPKEVFDFEKIDMPVLLMTGEYDVLAPPSEIKEISNRILKAASLPDVRFEALPNAGHVCNVEAPDVFNRILIEYLGRVLP